MHILLRSCLEEVTSTGDDEGRRTPEELGESRSILQGTYYGDAGGAGTCSFQYSDSASLPWASGTAFRVAMDQPFFYGSQTCGMCLAMHGTGPGSGGMSSLYDFGSPMRINSSCQHHPSLQRMQDAIRIYVK